MSIIRVLSNLVDDIGRIQVVQDLNGTLTDDTSVKQAQIKTFFCLI